MTSVLFLHATGEDYLSDSLLHGLRSVLGAAVVDVPRRDALYDDLTADRRAKLYGRGFTLYGRLPEVEVDRSAPLRRALDGEFRIVLIADIHRNWAPWLELRPHLKALRAAGATVAVCDGGDGPVLFPHGPTWWTQMRPWPLPRVAGRVRVFKRELCRTTAVIRYHGLLPPPLAERALARHVDPIGFSIPAEHLATGDEPRERLLAAQVVDPELRELLGLGDGGYRFEREADYFADMRASRFGVTTKKAGWDAMRHYEIAASGAVPCFRDLHRKPALASPFGLEDGVNCIAYRSAAELLERIEPMPGAEVARLRAGALAWARENTTAARARGLLRALGA